MCVGRWYSLWRTVHGQVQYFSHASSLRSPGTGYEDTIDVETSMPRISRYAVAPAVAHPTPVHPLQVPYRVGVIVGTEVVAHHIPLFLVVAGVRG